MTAPRSSRLAQYAGATLFVAFVLVRPAGAADFQLDNVRLDFGAMVITAPKLMVKGSTLEREAFATLLDTKSGEPAIGRIDRLNATEITAPELVFTHDVGKQKQVTIYRDIRLVDIRDGKIASGESTGGTLAGESPSAGKMTGTLKRMGFEGLDIRQTARVLTERAQPGVDEPIRPLLRRIEQDGYSVDMGPAGRFSLGKMVGRDFGARVGREPMGEVFNHIMVMSEQVNAAGGKTDPADLDPARREAEKRLGLSMLALYDQIDNGSGELRDLVVNVVAPPTDGEPGAKAVPGAKAAPGAKAVQGAKTGPGAKADLVEVKIARIAYGQDAPAKSGFALEGMQFSGGGGKGLIDSISYSGFSFGSMIKALQEDLAKPSAETETIDWRRYVPTIGTVRMAGLSVDAPPMVPGKEPIKIALGTFELKAGEQLNGIPTSLALTIDKLVAPITEGTGNPAARDMIAMGIRSLDLSAKLDLAWEAARNELAIRQISFGGEGLARFNLSGTLGNVTKDLFASDVALAQVAALGATARGLSARLENFGLVEKLIANEARKAGRKPEEMRQQFAMIASLGLASILGPSDAAKTLTAAVSRFAASPGTLTVDASAKSTSGLGLADVIAITDPTEIFDKIDLKANAQ